MKIKKEIIKIIKNILRNKNFDTISFKQNNQIFDLEYINLTNYLFFKNFQK